MRQAKWGFLITAPPSVCVSAVLVSLAVWIQNPKKKVRLNSLVQGNGKTMILSHKISFNRKSKGPFISKLISRNTPALDAFFCICKHIPVDFMDRATATSHLPSQLFSCQERSGKPKCTRDFKISCLPHLKHVPVASRFHFDHSLSLQEWSPPKIVFWTKLFEIAHICTSTKITQNMGFTLHYQAHLRFQAMYVD